MRLETRAPAKLNLSLYVGATGADGRHALVSVMTPLDLHDTLTLEPAGGSGEDEVVCAGVEGPNLAGDALRLFRERTGWDGPPVRITIDKRIPVAAGLGGGSADAAAALRLASRHSGLGDAALLLDIAARLGSDVPSQIDPRTVLVSGGGEVLTPLDDPPRGMAVLVLPSTHALSTGAVYAEADRLGLTRDTLDGVDVRAHVNDLEDAARSLCPPIDDTIAEARATGAEHVMVAGSGPTVVAFHADRDAAGRAAALLSRRNPPPIVASQQD